MPYAIPTSVTEPLLLHGDALEELRKLPAASVDAYVSDPPSAIAFMGRKWDSFRAYEPVSERGRQALQALDLLGMKREDSGFVAFMLEHWVEVMRVLKPGAYVVAWALPKTSDLAGLAMRLAGLDMELPLLHLFSSGMKKGADIGKHLEAIELTGDASPRGIADARDITGQGCPADGETHAFKVGDSRQGVYRNKPGQKWEPTTEAAKRWDGYNSQLAPAFEHWLVARNPTKLTYARNVLEHGCGAMHTRACEIPRGAAERAAIDAKITQGGGFGTAKNTFGDAAVNYDYQAGNGWPKNVILSTGGECCPAAELDRQGVAAGLHSAGHKRGAHADFSARDGSVYNDIPSDAHPMRFGDSGGAARFYTQLPIEDLEHRFRYQAKARKRDAGLRSDIANDHNTIKTVALMRWIMRLVVPTAKATGGLPGVVLSSFLGSGTDGVAAVAEGFRFIGIEMQPATVRSCGASTRSAARTVPAPAPACCAKIGRAKAQARRSRRRKGLAPAPAPLACSIIVPAEFDSFGLAHSRIFAAIGSPEEAAKANELAPKGAQLGLL
jgi:site-specific DNA-methyltransferase (adenine-specific)